MNFPCARGFRGASIARVLMAELSSCLVTSVSRPAMSVVQHISDTSYFRLGLVVATGASLLIIATGRAVHANDASSGLSPRVTLQKGEWRKWRQCYVRLNETYIDCVMTRISVSSENGSINVHFEFDDTYDKGVTFVASENAIKRRTESKILTDLIALRSGPARIFASDGMCVIGDNEIACISEDGLVRGVAKD